jgi:predicted Zn-dependent peptidase
VHVFSARVCSATATGSRSRPEDYIFDHLPVHDAAFLDSTMRLPTVGSPESASGLTAEGIAAFVAQQYTTARTAASAAGAVEHTAVTDAVSSLLGISSSSAGSSGSGKREEVELPVATFVGSDKRMR